MGLRLVWAGREGTLAAHGRRKRRLEIALAARHVGADGGDVARWLGRRRRPVLLAIAAMMGIGGGGVGAT